MKTEIKQIKGKKNSDDKKEIEALKNALIKKNIISENDIKAEKEKQK